MDRSKATDRIRLADVAREAGVAISTVSRVFSNPERINFQTAAHVRAIANDLGYVPRPHRTTHTAHTTAGYPSPSDPKNSHNDTSYRKNTGSPHNSSRQHGLIALLVKDTSDGISSQILKGAQSAAMESDHAVSVVETGRSPKWTENMVNHLVDKVDGVILSTDQLTTETIQHLSKKLPLVVLNRPVDGVRCVIPDPLIGVTRTLLTLKHNHHRTVTYVAGKPTSWANSSRQDCITEMGTRLGLHVRHIGPVIPGVEGGFQAALALESDLPDAIICYNDLIAAGIVLRLDADNIRVPDDVSVVGFDNTLIAPIVTPSITTIRIPRAQMGQAAVQILLGKNVIPSLTPRDTELLQFLRDQGYEQKQYDTLVTRINTSLIVRRSIAVRNPRLSDTAAADSKPR